MQAAFKVAEHDGHGLDAIFVGEVFQAVFLDLVRGNAVEALLFRLEVHLFEFVVRNGKEISQFSRHSSP